jgi:alpha-glucosidase
MVDGVIAPDQVRDPQGLNLGVARTRDVCRTPFQWSAGPHAGFSNIEPWLPVAGGYETVNVAAQREDPSSVLALYRRLLHLRKATPALNRGSYRPVDVPISDCYLYLREHEGERFLIALNFGAASRDLDLSGVKGRGRVLISTGLDRSEEDVSLSRLTLRPHEGLMLVV